MWLLCTYRWNWASKNLPMLMPCCVVPCRSLACCACGAVLGHAAIWLFCAAPCLVVRLFDVLCRVVMSCYAMLLFEVLCMPCRVGLWRVVLHCVALLFGVLCCCMSYCAVPCCACCVVPLCVVFCWVPTRCAMRFIVLISKYNGSFMAVMNHFLCTQLASAGDRHQRHRDELGA